MKSKTKIFTCGMLAIFLMLGSVLFANVSDNKATIQTSGSLELSITI